MKRITAILLTISLTLAVGLFGAGCGGDEEPAPKERVPGSLLKPQKTYDELSPEEKAEREAQRVALLKEVMIWPDGETPERDVVADQKECEERMKRNIKLANSNALLQLTWLARCMAEKGWVMNPDAELPQ